MMQQILIDSSFLYALQDQRDPNFSRSHGLVMQTRFEALIPEVAINEVVYLVRHRMGQMALVQFLESFPTSGLVVQSLAASDYPRIADIMRTYRDAALDFVDCAIMALSERLNVTHVCTYDRRDFTLFRPRHCDYLTLLPE